MDKKFITKNKEETFIVAKDILNNLETNVILLKGELGAGKTTFSQGLLAAAGAEGPFTSPTFVIMKVYDLENSKFKIQSSKFRKIYHLDCYRVGSRDVLDLGWEEIIKNPANLVLVEWPERIQDILPKGALMLDFEIKGEKEREIKVSNF